MKCVLFMKRSASILAALAQPPLKLSGKWQLGSDNSTVTGVLRITSGLCLTFFNVLLKITKKESIHRLNFVFFRKLRLPFRCNWNTNVWIIITIFHKTSIFFLFTTFPGVCYGKVMIFADKPITKARVFNPTVKCTLLFTLFITNIKSLICD